MKDDRLYLHHMLERCRCITRFIGPGKETFMASEGLQDAVVRNVEVIGEAAKRVSAEARGRLASPKVGTRQAGVFTPRGCGLYADGVRSDA